MKENLRETTLTKTHKLNTFMEESLIFNFLSFRNVNHPRISNICFQPLYKMKNNTESLYQERIFEEKNVLIFLFFIHLYEF